MKKAMYMLPLMLLVMMTMAMAAYDAVWQCPISGSTATTTVKGNSVYTDDAVAKSCIKGANNATFEVLIRGDAEDWAEGQTISTTVTVKQGSRTVFTGDLNTIQNTSATDTGLIRFTDYGLVSSGKPAWKGNLSSGSYKLYFTLTNVTDSVQLLSSEKGFSSADPIRFTLDEEGSSRLKLAAYAETQEAEDDIQSLFGVKGLGGKEGSALLLTVLIVSVYWFFFRKQ